jgi:hypothetical protein
MFASTSTKGAVTIKSMTNGNSMILLIGEKIEAPWKTETVIGMVANVAASPVMTPVRSVVRNRPTPFLSSQRSRGALRTVRTGRARKTMPPRAEKLIRKLRSVAICGSNRRIDPETTQSTQPASTGRCATRETIRRVIEMNARTTGGRVPVIAA